ncbi:unnamed protein product [Strongylus vulgaris]|uniref:Endoplasmic reticulum vesicle transporter C-terminal domain-containing protein n=1 Tax=Strongylus vulgaris TaxID=40348 RepID=A0A3P7KVN2_STRVU|nr:unnamed protein product [Strongylus vulgaris]
MTPLAIDTFSKSELYVDDPGREGKIDVEVDVSFPYLKCEYLGVDIQDENGRHEVGFVDKTEKVPLPDDGCRFKAKFEINKVPGNFHLSTHSALQQPENPDMRHIIHSIHFGDEIPATITKNNCFQFQNPNVKGSFNALKGKSTLSSEPRYTHEYILNQILLSSVGIEYFATEGLALQIVPSIYEDMNGQVWNSYQYTYGHSNYLVYHHTGQIIPAVWFKYSVQPITVKHKEWRLSFYYFLTSICAVVGGTFTVAGIIDSTFFTITDIVRKHRIGKLS